MLSYRKMDCLMCKGVLSQWMEKNSVYPITSNISQNLCWPPSQIGFYLVRCMGKLHYTKMLKKDFGVKR